MKRRQKFQRGLLPMVRFSHGVSQKSIRVHNIENQRQTLRAIALRPSFAYLSILRANRSYSVNIRAIHTAYSVLPRESVSSENSLQSRKAGSLKVRYVKRPRNKKPCSSGITKKLKYSVRKRTLLTNMHKVNITLLHTYMLILFALTRFEIRLHPITLSIPLIGYFTKSLFPLQHPPTHH